MRCSDSQLPIQSNNNLQSSLMCLHDFRFCNMGVWKRDMHRIVAVVADGDGGGSASHNAGRVFAVVHCHHRTTAVLEAEAVNRKEVEAGAAAAAGIEMVAAVGTDTLVAAAVVVVAGTGNPDEEEEDNAVVIALVLVLVVDMAGTGSVLQAAIQR